MFERAISRLTAVRDRVDRADAAFALLVPLVLGLILGANQTRAGAFLPWGVSVIYWTLLSLVTWLAMLLATALVRKTLEPWRVSDWPIWVVGAILGSLAARPLLYAIAEAFRPMMRGPTLRSMAPPTLTLDFALFYLANWSTIVLLWVGASWLRRAAQGVEFGGEQLAYSGGAPGGDAAPADVLRRAGSLRAEHVLALKAEDHYTRIVTRDGDRLVLESLGSAIAQLTRAGCDGLRVHRSWWVAREGVLAVEDRGPRPVLRLVNGGEVPISRTYLERVREEQLA